MWIKFADMLPPENEKVLVSDPFGWLTIETLRTFTDGASVFAGGPYMNTYEGNLYNISAYINGYWWTPLPEPPTECRKRWRERKGWRER